MRSLPATLLISLASLSCATTPEGPAPEEPAFDNIVVRFSPSGDLDATDVQVHEIRDAATVARWSAALDALPPAAEVRVRKVKMRHDAPEHAFVFRDGDRVVDTARMKAGRLDIQELDEWAFYSGEDDAFVTLVEQVTGKR